MYLYTANKVSNRATGDMLAEWSYTFPLLFQPLFSGKTSIKQSDLFAEAKAGVAALESFFDFIEAHADTMIDRRDAWDTARQKIFAVLHKAAESPWLMLEASDVYGMSDTPFADQAQELLAELTGNVAVFEDAIAANNSGLLDDFPDLRSSGFTKFRDWLNYESFDYGWELLWASMEKYNQSDAPEIFKKNGLFGLRTASGTVLCEPTYQEIFGFHELSQLSVAATVDGKFGYLNYQGQTALPFVFDDAFDFYDEYDENLQRAPAVIQGRYGLINRQGAWVAEPCWDDLRYIYEDGRMVAVKQGNLWAVLDRDGQVLVAPSLPGRPVGDNDYEPRYFICKDEDDKPLQYFSLKWKAIDWVKGSKVSDQYNPLTHLIMQQGEGKSARYGLVGSDGNVLLATDYDQLTYHEGFALFVAKQNRKTGLYSATDGWLLPCEYDSIKHPKDEHIYSATEIIMPDPLCIVRQGKSYGVFNYQKKTWVLPCAQGKIVYYAKHVLGILHAGKTDDAGWWVHRCSDGVAIAGPYVSLNDLQGQLNFAAVLGFTADAVHTIGQTGLCKPLTEQQADSLAKYDFQTHCLDNAQMELVIKACPAKKRGALLYEQAGNLYDAKKYADALPLLHQAAELGYGEALALIGNIYDFTDEYRDPTVALQWYQRAAEAGSLIGLNNYALSLRDGTGVDADIPQAVKLFTQAMDGGYSLAALNLAETYYNNKEYQDYDKALDCYLKAHRDYPVPIEIGWLYDNHRQDYTNALKYYRDAAKDNEGYALRRIGEFWQYGLVGTANPDKAAEFFRKAMTATYPDPYAGLSLAELLITSDPKAAIEAWQVAMSADISEAKEFGKQQGWC